LATKRLRILFCNFEYPPLGGGGGVVMAALARELAKRHDVTALTSRAGDLPATSVDGGVQVVRVPVWFRRELPVANFSSMLAYLPSAAWRGLLMRPTRSFDVINTHFVVPSGPVGQFLRVMSGVPNVLSVHGGDLFDPSKNLSPHRHAWLRGPIASLLRSADAIVGQSRDTIRHVSEMYGVTRPVELIPLGIERPPQPASATRERFGLPRDAFVMVTIGRLVARKSTAQLVEALAASALPRAHLVIVGDGPDAEAIRKAAHERGVSDRVHLLGLASDEEKYCALAVADLFVSTSQHEGFGLVFLEAMAFGLPIVCYDHGGQTDFLQTGITGHVIKLNDLEAFARALIELERSLEVRQQIAANNLQRVEEYFIDRCAERYESLFESVVRVRADVRSERVR
jgi:glycosyltransferase involved in cell wall biosynthesis